jgi:hypothetical protein
MNLRIHYVFPLCLLFACDKVERDWSKCSEANSDCKSGYTCSRPSYRCVPLGDGGADVAIPPSDAAAHEVAGADMAKPDAAADIPADVALDAAADVELDGSVDAADAAADKAVDTRPVDSQGSCGSDIDCPASAPMCLDFRCARCASNNDCADRGDGGSGANVCDTTSGLCVACAKSSDCTADPARPVCVANQCAACSSATNECRSKNSLAPVCDSSSGKCVGCLSNDNCAGSAGVSDAGTDGGTDGGVDGGVVAGLCYLTTKQCVECLAHADCKDPSRPICGVLHTCVGCGLQLAPSDGCPTKNSALPVCMGATGACVECVSGADCHGDAGTGVCSPTTNKCVECNDNTNCTTDPSRAFCVKNSCTGCQTAGAGACTGAKPMCATTGGSIGQCVECNGDNDCKVGTKPVCDANQCRACKKDLECSGASQAGVCGLDGSCPAEDAVIYLQNSAACSTSSGDGTLATPYCSSDEATAHLSATKSIIVIKGNGPAYPVGPLTMPSLGSTRLLMAGQSSARISNLGVGSHVLVSIAAGDVTLRDLTISGGNDAGISVSGGATLHMDRCYVLNNQGIGIQISASAFDIVNTVIAGNGAAAGGYGVSLGNYSGSPTNFAFNTVVNNVGGGVFCGAPSDYALIGILANGNGPTNFLNCQTNSTSSTAAPNFGSNYHLTAASPCVNAGGATCPPDDIDDDTRPIGSACDCGADEYKSN